MTSGKSFGNSAHFDLEQNVLKNAAAVLDAGGFARRFNWHHDGHLLVFGNFMEIHMQHLAAQRMMLDFLHQCEPLGPRVILDREVHQQVLRDGMVNQIVQIRGGDLQALGLLLPAINDRRNAPGIAQFFRAAAPGLRAGIGIQ